MTIFIPAHNSSYDWPQNLNQPVIFPIRPDETSRKAQKRIGDAARMTKLHFTWTYKTQRLESGIQFEWIEKGFHRETFFKCGRYYTWSEETDKLIQATIGNGANQFLADRFGLTPKQISGRRNYLKRKERQTENEIKNEIETEIETNLKPKTSKSDLPILKNLTNRPSFFENENLELMMRGRRSVYVGNRK